MCSVVVKPGQELKFDMLLQLFLYLVNGLFSHLPVQKVLKIGISSDNVVKLFFADFSGELAPALSATINITGNLVDFVLAHFGNDR